MLKLAHKVKYNFMPKVKIRLQKISDAERFYEILNSPKYSSVGPHPKSVVEEKIWLKENAKRRKENTNWDYTILFDGKVVGGIGIKINYHRSYIGEVGYFVDENYWGRGIASRAVELAEAVCFKKLKLKRLEILVSSENKASEKVAIKNGYKKEGLLKKAVKSAGNKYEDRHLYAKVL